MTYASKTLLFFYQILAFLTFRSSIQVIKPLAEVANLNLDVSEDGTCLFKDVTARGKLWLSLLPPLILSIDLFILFAGIEIQKLWQNRKNKDKKKDIDNQDNNKKLLFIFNCCGSKDGKKKEWTPQEIAFQSALWGIFMIVYVQIASAFIKLSICYPFGEKNYMWYAGDTPCYDGGHYFSIAMSVLLIFAVPFGLLRVMKYFKENHNEAPPPGPDGEIEQSPYQRLFASLILSYHDRCWFYSAFNVFRRAILIVLPSIPTSNLSLRATLVTFTCGCLICYHCYKMPFS